MTSNTRRPGFRLWGSDSADESEEAAEQTEAAQAGAEKADAEPAAPDQAEPGKAPEQAEAAEQTEAAQVDAEKADAEKAEAEQAELEQAAAAAPEHRAAPPPGAPAGTPAPDSAGFLASLVEAMRSVAEEARADSLADLRTAVDERTATLEREAADRADDLRRQADLDISGIADWERTEVERVKTEAQDKTTARRELLEKMLVDHQAASEQRVAAARARLEQHERELTAFFAGLSEIKDPSAFVEAAGKMPQPPSLTDEAPASPAEGAERETLDARLSKLGVEHANSAEEAAGTTRDAQLAERLAELDTTLSEAPTETPAAETPAAETPAAETPVAEAPPAETPAAETPVAEAAVEAPAAKPDAETSAQAATTAPATPVGEASTAIVVKGLGSFGAITSFKQALERVEGIQGVTLSLGPTGEFVYRASHAPGYDVIGAVQSIEGDGAEIEQADDSLRVTVARNR